LSLTRKIADFAEYMATPPKNSWTLGEMLTKATGGEFKVHTNKMNRAGRLVERGIFAAGVAFGVAGIFVEASIGPLILAPLIAKGIGFLSGSVVDIAADHISDVAQNFDRRMANFGRWMKNKTAPGVTNADQEQAKQQRAELRAARKAAERQRKKNKPGLFDRGPLHAAAKIMNWLNEEPKHKYTLGEGLRFILGKDPSPHGLHAGRLGRFVERATTIGLSYFALNAMTASVGLTIASLPVIATAAPVFIPITLAVLAASKLIGVVAGGTTHVASQVVGGVVNNLDNKFSRMARKAGASPANRTADTAPGSRPAPEMQPQGPGSTLAQQRSISADFSKSAQRTAPGNDVSYSPLGPRARENFNFDGETKPKPQPQQARM